MLNHRFHILQKLGTGGFGEVWDAYDYSAGETVAIKFVIIASSTIYRQTILNNSEMKIKFSKIFKKKSSRVVFN